MQNKKIKYALFVMIVCIMTVLLCPLTLVSAKKKSSASTIKFDKEKITLYTGWESYLCDVLGMGEEFEISYRSDDEDIAAISPEGEIFPVEEGSTTVYADVKKAGAPGPAP